MRVDWGIETVYRMEAGSQGSSSFEGSVCLTHETCLTVATSTVMTVELSLQPAVRLEVVCKGGSDVSLPLLRRIPRLPDWWRRTTVKDKSGTVSYFWDKPGETILAIQYKGGYYQP